MELVKSMTKYKGAYVRYSVPGLRGLIYFPTSIIQGEAPATLEVNGVTFVEAGATKEVKAKMTPEEKAAAKVAAAEARRNQTPAQKIEAEKARLAKQQARIAKMEAAAAVAV